MSIFNDDILNSEVVVLGGGCFWCTEAVFKMLKGVLRVEPGYAGGTPETHNYEEVSTGMTGHAEVVRIKFNPRLISFEQILAVFFATHDATSINRQGTDVGSQYRSVIFYTTKEQEKRAKKFIMGLNASNKFGKLIVTEILPLTVFFPAENYHKDYYSRNKNQPYCQAVINPKLGKVQSEFAKLLKK